MERFDDEIERVLSRAGRAAAALSVLALLILILGVAGGIGLASSISGGAWIWVILGALVTAGLLYGLGMVITLIGMHLMETWRQGRRSAGDGSDH